VCTFTLKGDDLLLQDMSWDGVLRKKI
jgi:hypothetical protein